jgi:hypothetical protein
MKIDPDRSITITLPFGMVEKLTTVKPILAMFRDEGDVKKVIDIIDAIHSGAIEYIREEEGKLNRMLSEDIDGVDLDGFFDEEDEEEDVN